MTTSRLPRVPLLEPAQMSPEQKRIHDVIASGPRGQVRGPLAVWLHRPAMAEHAQALGQYCRYETSLPTRLSEWAILILARHWRSEYEWWAHKPLAIKAGVAPAMIEALRDGKPVPYSHDDEALIHEFLDVLHETRRIPQDLYDRIVHRLGEAGVIDLVSIAGYYTLIAMTLGAFDIQPPDGVETELDGLDPA
ncbi:carboxymuconolactone decarboxylase family protein [Bordetella genomosp. 9]|uniref:carboxymuconolactone decarboxylase family protein n=1 Tax=Bordetella genomosp. 9 TaxID=1416803 RepID=UPI001E3A956E|nr:carboxymuconolactone decarboxylase family protein [Bordetella genomosp. 9]